MITSPHFRKSHPNPNATLGSAWQNALAHGGQVRTTFDPQFDAGWVVMPPNGILGFNLDLLREIWSVDQSIADAGGVRDETGSLRPIRFYVAASRFPQTYGLGDDLELLLQFITSKNRNALAQYAGLHVDIMHRRLNSFGRSIVSLFVVTGEALGAGFEAALATDVLIAERSSQLGFPGILYNLFPGMGGYSVLVRKIGQRRTEEMIASGSIFTGAELADLGVVDVLAEDGQGRERAIEFMRERLRSHSGYSAMLRARKAVSPISREELQRVAAIWVDAALRLDEKDLRAMQWVINAQRANKDEAPEALDADGMPLQHVGSTTSH